MNNEIMLEKTLNATIERLGQQATKYEAEIANLNAQIIVLQDRLAQASSKEVQENTEDA